MKFYKNWKFKLPVYIGLPVFSIVTATTFGLVSFSSNLDEDSKVSKAISFGDNFYDKKIANSAGNTLENQIVFPLGGKSLLNDLIILDKSSFTTNNKTIDILSFNGNKKDPKKKIEFNLREANSYKEVNKKFVEINKEIYDFIKDPKNSKIFLEKRFAVYFYKNNHDREITIEIYELKDDHVRRKIANDFTDKINPFFAKPASLDFIDPIWVKRLVDRSTIENKLWYKNSANVTYRSIGSTKRSILIPQVGSIGYKDSFSDQNIDLPDELLSNQMIATFYPVINLEKNKIDFIFDFSVLNSDSVLIKPYGAEYVINPKNIIRVIRSQKISDILKKTPHDSNFSKAIPNNLQNQKLLKEKLSVDWINYIRKPFIKPSLAFLNSQIPQMNNIVSLFSNTLEALSRLKDKKNKEGKDILNLIFDEKDPKINKNLVEKIIDNINDNSDINNPNRIFQATLFFDIAFSNKSKINPTKKWTSIKSFTNPSNEIINNAIKASPARELYTLLIGFNSISKVIHNRINELLKTNQIGFDPYDEVELNPILNSLFNILKDNKIIAKDTKIADVISNVYDFIKIILKKSNQNLAFPIESKYWKVILHLIPLENKAPQESIDQASKTLGDIFKDKDNVLSLLKLLDTNDVDQLINIFKDIKNNLRDLIYIIGRNVDEQKEILTKLGKALIDKKALSQIVLSNPNKLDISWLIEKLIMGFNNKTNLVKLASFLEDVQPGIGNLISILDFDDIVSIVESFIDIKQGDVKQLFHKVIKSGFRSLSLVEIEKLLNELMVQIPKAQILKTVLTKDILDIISQISDAQSVYYIAKIVYYLSR